MNGIWIHLTPAEHQVATWLAKQRMASNQRAGVRERIRGKDDPLVYNIQGMCGEMAFAKHHNVFPDMDICPQAHTYDCELHGMSVDVKTTHHQNGNLFIEGRKKSAPASVYALMIAPAPGTDEGRYLYCGWAWGFEAVSEDRYVEKFGAFVTQRNALAHGQIV